MSSNANKSQSGIIVADIPPQLKRTGFNSNGFNIQRQADSQTPEALRRLA